MTNSKHTKHALLSSVIALILCCSMLVGTTFAWFTDSVQSMNNVITAGNLDVEVTQNNTDIREIELFDDILWEPGVVAYENITVENVGTLALQYDLFINFGDQNYVVDAQGNLTEYDLSDVLQVAIVPEGVNESNRDTLIGSITDWALLKELKSKGKLYPVGNADQFASAESFGIVIWWKPGAEDNNWNVHNGKTTTDGQPLHINLGVNVYAQQLPYEEDSFDQWYDLQADAPNAVVNVLDPQVIAATWGMGGSDVDIDNTRGLPLNCMYQFLPSQTQDEALASGYGYWHADFVVTVDRDITEGQAAVAGYYSAFCDDYNDTKWVALSADLAANTPVRLVEGMGNGAITVNYNELCYYSFLDTNTKDGFWCGAWADESLNGMTLTVELRLYETEGDPLDPNGPKNIETGNYITVATYTHTFSTGVSTASQLENAVASGVSNITLVDDIDLGDTTLNVAAGADVTINLNGHTISQSKECTDSHSMITNEGNLTITGDGKISLTDTGANDGSSWGSYTISNRGGNLVIESGVIEHIGPNAHNNVNNAIFNYSGNTVINGGTISVPYSRTIRLWNGSVTVSGGEFDGQIWVQAMSDCSLTINGGSFQPGTQGNDGSSVYVTTGSHNVSVSVTGGNFATKFGCDNASKLAGCITGGTFSAEAQANTNSDLFA